MSKQFSCIDITCIHDNERRFLLTGDFKLPTLLVLSEDELRGIAAAIQLVVSEAPALPVK